MHIKILGSGCAKCNSLVSLVKKVVEANGIEATTEKVEDILKIMEYKVLSTPALVINEHIVSAGRIPSEEEILAFLNEKKV